MIKFFKAIATWLRGSNKPVRNLVFMGRCAVRDVAITFRMKAGFAGDVNRTHPASIEPVLIDASAPPTIYGQPVLIDATTQGIRPFTSTDTTTPAVAYGALVRSLPQQALPTATFGAPSTLGGEVPPASGAADVLRSGYIMAKVVGTPVKDAQAYVWIAASSGAHIQGGLEAAAGTPGTNTALLTGWTFNGGADADGIAEIAVNI